MARVLNIIMTHPPGPDSQFVEIEDDEGHSLRVGTWEALPPDAVHQDTWWRLRVDLADL